MVAMLLLAICVLPMSDAIRNGINASAIAAAKARELRCIKNTMESVLAEPYQNLFNLAAGKDTPSAYARPADASCDAPPQVFIAWYEHEFGKPPVFLPSGPGALRPEAPLLYITVAAANDGYSLTTLVAR